MDDVSALISVVRRGCNRRLTVADWFAANLPGETSRHHPDLPRELAQVVLAANDGLFLAQQIDDYRNADEIVAVIVDIVGAAVSDQRSDVAADAEQ